MKVVKPFLTAIVSKTEYDQGIGQEFPNLFMVTEDFSIFKRTKLAEGGSCLLRVPELPKVESTEGTVDEKIDFLPGGRIPFDYLTQIIAFFKKVMEVNFGGSNSGAGQDCEAMAHILWNKEEKKYEIGIPTQRVSKASVSYEFDHIDQEKHVVIVDIHSHNSMSAFFSGTDDADDKKGCWFAGVAGQLNRDVCQIKFRFTNYGIFRDVKLEEIFEAESYELTLPETVPDSWMEKVKGTYSSTSKNYGGGRNWGTWGHNQHNYPKHRGRDEFNREDVDSRLAWMYADMGGYEDYDSEDFWRSIGFGEDNNFRQGRDERVTQRRLPPPNKGKSSRANAGKDYYGRIAGDAIEAIDELPYPLGRAYLMKVIEAAVKRVKEGISSDDSGALTRAQYDTFLLEVIEHVTEQFTEIYQGEDIETYQIPFIVSCLQGIANWDCLVQIHEDLLDYMGATYKDNAHMDVLVDYLCENEKLLSAENFYRIQEIIKDAKVQH